MPLQEEPLGILFDERSLLQVCSGGQPAYTFPLLGLTSLLGRGGQLRISGAQGCPSLAAVQCFNGVSAL